VRGWTRAGALVDLFAVSTRPIRAGLARPTAIYASVGGGEGMRPSRTVDPLAARLSIPVKRRSPLSLQATKPGSRARSAPAQSTPTLICWDHEKISDIASALHPVTPSPPAAWPGDRFDIVWTFKPDSTGWTFAQIPQLLLAGDSARSHFGRAPVSPEPHASLRLGVRRSPRLVHGVAEFATRLAAPVCIG